MHEHTPVISVPAAGSSTARSLRKLRPYLWPCRWRLCTVSALAALASLLALAMPQVLKWIVDGPVARRDPRGVALGGLALLLLGAAEASLFGVRRRLAAGPLADIEARMRADLHRHAQRLPLAAHDGWTSGQLLSRGTSDPQVIHMFIAGPLTFLPVHAATLAVGAAILVSQQWLLALVVLAPVPLLVIESYRFESRYADVTRRALDLSGDLTTAVLESVAGIRVIKGFRRGEDRIARFRDQVRRVREAELDKARLLGGMSAVTTVLPGLATVGALATGAVQAADGQLSIGSLLAFLGTVAALRPAVEGAGGLLAGCHDAAAAADRYFEVLGRPMTDEPDPGDDEPDVVAGEPDPGDGEPGRVAAEGGARGNRPTWTSRPPGPDASPRSPGARRPAELAFARVDFRYSDAPAGDPPALREVTLRVAPGETLAVVGATGSGKSTLAALAARLYDPVAGRITLDGVDITRVPRAELRSAVAVAFDEPVLFTGTVMDNVLMGAEAGADEIDEALRAAGVDEFVHRLADGPRTRVGEGGMSLSGGQRQRIALARIMVRRPRLAVLDDPLSALDLHTEARVQDALREVLASTTAVVVAHRLSTVLMADRVALLEGGRVTAAGTHEELLAASPAYAALMTPIDVAAHGQEGA
ncbi:ABC transporter ATP-binding protein [Streptomyces sp. NPDC088194]|uniref:ABC transporter ATP-binding protein n=1 Tax=Streptomyces sp. NPDC088194 TaxID=3154931 RepID=UPI00344CB2E7